MKALVLVREDDVALKPLNEYLSAALVPLVDRPFLQHLIELLVSQGFREFQIFSCEFPEKIEELLGDGTRWGSSVTCHLGRHDADLWQRLRMVTAKLGSRPVLLCTTRALPFLSLKPLMEQAAGGRKTMLTTPSPEGARSIGWYITDAATLASLPTSGEGPEIQAALEEIIAKDGHRESCESVLPWADFQDFINGQRLFLEGKCPGLLCNAREAAPGIRIERNVSLHPTAELTGPVFIGENTQIADRVKLGPNVVIRPNCIVDAQATVKESLILRGSYIGETLEVENTIVRCNRLINVTIGGAVDVPDDFILGSIGDIGIGSVMGRIFWRVLAALLLVLALPMLLILVVVLGLKRGGEIIFWREGVRIPTDRDPETLEVFQMPTFRRSTSQRPYGGKPSFNHLCLDLLPGLFAVVRGDIMMVGLPVRSCDDVRLMFPEWQTLYLKGRAGLFSETQVVCGEGANNEEAFLSEAYYRTREGFWYDCQLILRYLAALVPWPRK